MKVYGVFTSVHDLSPKYAYGTVAITWPDERCSFYILSCDMSNDEFIEMTHHTYEGAYYLNANGVGPVYTKGSAFPIFNCTATLEKENNLRYCLAHFDNVMQCLIHIAVYDLGRAPVVFAEAFFPKKEHCDASVVIMTKAIWAAPDDHSKIMIRYRNTIDTFAVWRVVAKRSTLRKDLVVTNVHDCYIGYNNIVTVHKAGQKDESARICHSVAGDMIEAMISIDHDCHHRLSPIRGITMNDDPVPIPDTTLFREYHYLVDTVDGRVDEAITLKAEVATLTNKLKLVDRQLRDMIGGA